MSSPSQYKFQLHDTIYVMPSQTFAEVPTATVPDQDIINKAQDIAPYLILAVVIVIALGFMKELLGD